MNLEELTFFNNGSDLWASDTENISLIGTAHNTSHAEKMASKLNDLICEIYDCKENDKPIQTAKD